MEVAVTRVPFGKEQEAREPSHPSPLPRLLHLDALMTLAKIYKCSPAILTLRTGCHTWKTTYQL